MKYLKNLTMLKEKLRNVLNLISVQNICKYSILMESNGRKGRDKLRKKIKESKM